MPRANLSMTRKTGPGLLLNVAVVAWLGIMVMPCTAFAAGLPIEVTETASVVQVDCHGAHEVAEISDPECCCDLLAVTGGDAPKSQRVDVVAAVLAAPPLILTVEHITSNKRAHRPPQSDSRQPVYLTTQRFRI